MVDSLKILISVAAILCAVAKVEGTSYDPMIYLNDVKSLALLETLPFEDNPSILEKENQGEYLCPAENQDDIKVLQKASEKSYRFKSCLFKRDLSSGEDKMCKFEPTPVITSLREKQTKNAIRCSPEDNYIVYYVGFFKCGKLENIAELLQLQDYDEIIRTGHYHTKHVYTICFDSKKNDVFSTEHHILAVSLFFNPQANSEKDCSAEIGTDPFFFNDSNKYVDVKREYDAEKQKDPSKEARMVPQRLVPCEHIPLPVWKVAANHYINTAPLWETLVPLMKVIDEGIKRAQLNLYLPNPSATHHLQINTRVKEGEDKPSNVWYKLVHRMGSEAGILIVIHNNPGNPPKLNTSSPTCDFKSWTKNEKLRNAITEEMLKYAECREVAMTDDADIFYLDMKIQEYLDLDGLIKNGLSSSETSSKSSPAMVNASKDADESSVV